MRVLLDECVPRPLGRSLPDHAVGDVAGEGWSGLKNGALLAAASNAGYEVFVTVDQNLAYQQNLGATSLAIVVLRGATNRLAELRPLAGELNEAIKTASVGALTIVTKP